MFPASGFAPVLGLFWLAWQVIACEPAVDMHVAVCLHMRAVGRCALGQLLAEHTSTAGRSKSVVCYPVCIPLLLLQVGKLLAELVREPVAAGAAGGSSSRREGNAGADSTTPGVSAGEQSHVLMQGTAPTVHFE
jgi:hypothetical protein